MLPGGTGRVRVGNRLRPGEGFRAVRRQNSTGKWLPGLPVFQDYRCQMQVRPTRNSHDPRQYLFRGVRQGFAIDE